MCHSTLFHVQLRLNISLKTFLKQLTKFSDLTREVPFSLGELRLSADANPTAEPASPKGTPKQAFPLRGRLFSCHLGKMQQGMRNCFDEISLFFGKTPCNEEKNIL